MLTGGSGDGNLAPTVSEGADLGETLSRVRTMLKFGVLSKGRQVRLEGKEREEMLLERWKAIFSKYDRDGSGILTLEDVRHMVRLDLKISERLVSDEQLRQVFESMDEDGGGSIEFDEFMSFVNQKPPKSFSEEDVVRNVGRAVRLALHRSGTHIKDLESKFRTYDDLDPVTGELGPMEMRRFFRNVLAVSKHECSDRNLRIAFTAVDEDGSGSMSTEEFLEFIKFCFQGCPSREVPTRLQGLIGGSGDLVRQRKPQHRPGTLPGVPGLAAVPFCLSGRDAKAAHRIGSCLGPILPPILAPAKSTPSLSGAAGGDGEGRRWHSPQRPLGEYRTFKGAQALNRVEQQLFEVGVDARGMYHHL